RGEKNGDAAQPGGDREAAPDQLVDREVLVLEGRTEIALQDVAEVAQVLLSERFVEVVDALEARLDLGGNRLLGAEWPAPRQPDEEEGDGDDEEDRRHRAEQPLHRIAQHPGVPPGDGVAAFFVPSRQQRSAAARPPEAGMTRRQSVGMRLSRATL